MEKNYTSAASPGRISGLLVALEYPTTTTNTIKYHCLKPIIFLVYFQLTTNAWTGSRQILREVIAMKIKSESDKIKIDFSIRQYSERLQVEGER